MIKSNGRQAPPVWVGFHRDALLIVLGLDCLWMGIEVATATTIVGIPAIPFIAFSLFGISSWIVFSKQRALGDSYIQATWKSIFLGMVAGVPIPVFYTCLFGIFAIINKIAPSNKAIQFKLPTLTEQRLGRFLIEFKTIEDSLKRAVEQIDAEAVDQSIKKNIGFLKKHRSIPVELAESLDNFRESRNDFVHLPPETPGIQEIREVLQFSKDVKPFVPTNRN